MNNLFPGNSKVMIRQIHIMEAAFCRVLSIFYRYMYFVQVRTCMTTRDRMGDQILLKKQAMYNQVCSIPLELGEWWGHIIRYKLYIRIECFPLRWFLKARVIPHGRHIVHVYVGQHWFPRFLHFSTKFNLLYCSLRYRYTVTLFFLWI